MDQTGYNAVRLCPFGALPPLVSYWQTDLTVSLKGQPDSFPLSPSPLPALSKNARNCCQRIGGKKEMEHWELPQCSRASNVLSGHCVSLEHCNFFHRLSNIRLSYKNYANRSQCIPIMKAEGKKLHTRSWKANPKPNPKRWFQPYPHPCLCS